MLVLLHLDFTYTFRRNRRHSVAINPIVHAAAVNAQAVLIVVAEDAMELEAIDSVKNNGNPIVLQLVKVLLMYYPNTHCITSFFIYCDAQKHHCATTRSRTLVTREGASQKLYR